MGAACSRRAQKAPAATPFWEEIDKAKAEHVEEKEDVVKEKDEVELPGYEQANHLKGQGKDKFAKGEVEEATACWLQALDSLQPNSKSLLGLLEGVGPEEEDRRIRELRVALLSNLALASMKQKKFRPAVSFCEEVLALEPGNVKALFRKAEALGELCDWHEAEEAAQKLQASGEEGAKLAQQKREEWKRRQRQADGRQKKMWSAALDKEKEKPVAPTPVTAAVTSKAVEESWTPPKLEFMSPFDLRNKQIQWEEDDDFNDKIWKQSLGRREADYYQKRALPLTLLAASALAELDICRVSEVVVHCILDGNMAPFSDPHDWSIFLKRCPEVSSLLVVYVDLGFVGLDDGKPPPGYGTLLRPTEEGRCGDRVARAARFMGTYQEFKQHCRDLPGLVRPHVALWADVALHGFHDEDLSTRLEALRQLKEDGVSCVFTMGGEVQDPGSPPIPQKLCEMAKQSIAILSVGLGFRKLMAWHWNRFIVPLDRGPQGIMAGHAVVGAMKPGKASYTLQSVKELCQRRQVALSAAKAPQQPSKQERQKFMELRDRQWQAFCRHLEMQGRSLAGPKTDDEERRRQMAEWRQFVGEA